MMSGPFSIPGPRMNTVVAHQLAPNFVPGWSVDAEDPASISGVVDRLAEAVVVTAVLVVDCVALGHMRIDQHAQGVLRQSE